ncbi:MAG TPA: 5,6-dimethylbenzimidazole synthase [Streptosporangiaceae bacterium]|jgi:nicotinate-nucleotide--dimethylbenzimidazole phosphoribosyltransferase
MAATPWPRPRPLIGDTTSSAERAADPASWALPGSTQAALAEVIAARRDVRRFRPDPVSDELVTELLAAGHAAPSIGHSQPWRFIVVRDPMRRASAAVLADQARLAQARQLDPDSARHLRSLQLEGIREAPVGIVVCCDRRARPAGVLGRATFPDADLWSCACAVQNIWLTARARGLGLGWVTLFEPAELHALLGLPGGVVTLGWLCVGWPDERLPAPGLERHGWSQRLPLARVTLRDRWPADAPPPPRDRSAPPATPAIPAATPAAPPSGPAVPPATPAVPPSGPAAPATTPPSAARHAVDGGRVRARDAEDRLLAAPGSLGLLGDILIRAEAASPAPGAGSLVIAAADHPVTALRVSAFPPSTTRLVARALAAGEGQGAAMARAAGAAIWLADCGIDGDPLPGWQQVWPGGRRGDLAAADALQPGAVTHLLAAGRELGGRLAAAGPVALGEVGIGNTTVAAALAAALLAVPAGAAAGRGAGSDTALVTRKQQVITRALARVSARLPAPGPLSWPGLVDLISAVGGPEQAFLTGVCLGAADAGGLVLLDGLLTSVSALIAVRHRAEVQAHLIAGQLSAEPAHRLVLDALGLEPLLDLRLRAGEGVGAVLALILLGQARAARRLTATTS